MRLLVFSTCMVYLVKYIIFYNLEVGHITMVISVYIYLKSWVLLITVSTSC